MGRAEYIRDPDVDNLSVFLAARISQSLASGKVLWLLSGGSAMLLAAATREHLQANLGNLLVSLVDERYGPVGHPDSNWQQLLDAGFNFSQTEAFPVLVNLDISETTDKFNEFLQKCLDDRVYVVGLLGMGADGHTAGILPASPALRANTLATSYKGPDYLRITATGKFIARMDEAYLYAVGKTKRPQLEKLKLELPAHEQPAQLLKKAAKLTIINDTEGENI